MRISFARSTSNYDDLLVDSNIIETLYSLKLLGVTLSKDLRWNTHIDLLIKKTSKRLFFITKIKRAKVSPEDLIKFYVTCIRSVFLYACQVYHYSLPEYLGKSLEQIQKRAMKIIYGYDTSYNSALEQAGINKLSDCRQLLCNKFFSKVIANSADRLHDLVPYNEHQRNYLRNVRPFTIPVCKTNRFKKSFLISSSLFYSKNILNNR